MSYVFNFFGNDATNAINDFVELSLITYVVFLASLAKLKLNVCYNCMAVTTYKHTHNWLLDKNEREIYTDIVFDKQRGFMDVDCEKEILAEHSKRYSSRTILEIAEITAQMFEDRNLVASKAFNCGLNFFFEKSFDQIREKEFYEVIDNSVQN